MRKLIIILALILVGTVSWAQNGFLSGGWLHDDWPAEVEIYYRREGSAIAYWLCQNHGFHGIESRKHL